MMQEDKNFIIGSSSATADASDGFSGKTHIDYSTIECQICRKKGHFASKCFFRYAPPSSSADQDSSQCSNSAAVQHMEQAFSGIQINAVDICDDPSGAASSAAWFST